MIFFKLTMFNPLWNPPPPPPLEIVLLKFIIDVDKCLTKCMRSVSMHCMNVLRDEVEVGESIYNAT